MHELNVYKMIDKNGNIADRGTAEEISKKYYKQKSTVYKAVEDGFWYVGEYHIVKDQ